MMQVTPCRLQRVAGAGFELPLLEQGQVLTVSNRNRALINEYGTKNNSKSQWHHRNQIHILPEDSKGLQAHG